MFCGFFPSSNILLIINLPHCVSYSTKNDTESAHLQFLQTDTHLLGDNVSLPHMDVDGVQRGWQEQVLTLTVERLTLECKTRPQRETGEHFSHVFPQKPSNMVAFNSKQTKMVKILNLCDELWLKAHM